MDVIEKARLLAKEGDKESAIRLLRDELEKAPGVEQEESLLYELGVIYHGMADYRQALNCFNAVLRLNDDHKQARTQVEMINSILNYFNKDLLNP